MKDTELRQERDRDLYRVYERGLQEQHFENMKEAAAWTCLQPAEKFYISSKALVNYIGAIRNGKDPGKMFSQNAKKMEMLYGMFQDYLESHPGCTLSRERICEILVDEPAPRFFIGQDSALKALKRERDRRQMEMIRRARR